MNSYELSRKWFDWCFDNASKIRPIHTALFFFIIEHNNRLGWKKEFGLPRDMAMDAIGVKNNRTYSAAFNDLEKWKFIKVVERSKNQYSANIISLFGCVKNTPATTSALDEAMLKHLHKQSIGIAPIDKPNNIITYKPNNNNKEVEISKNTYEEKDFLINWNESRGHYTEIKNGTSKLKQDELDLFIDIKNSFTKQDFHIALGGLFKQEKVPSSIMWARPKHFLQNIDTYIDAANNNLYTLYK